MITPDELARLWRNHAAGLLLMCRSRCDCPEDCVQEAFIRLARQEPPPDDPLAWLARVARNEALSAVRSARRRRVRETLPPGEQAPWFQPVDEALIAGEEAEQVRVALQQLDPDDREIVVAHVWAGLTFRQIAEAHGITKSTASRCYQRGLAELRGMLDPLFAKSSPGKATR